MDGTAGRAIVANKSVGRDRDPVSSVEITARGGMCRDPQSLGNLLAGLRSSNGGNSCGDVTTGAEGVTFGGFAPARIGDKVSDNDAKITTGASNVRVAGPPAAREGDDISCDERTCNPERSVVIVTPAQSSGSEERSFVRRTIVDPSMWFLGKLKDSVVLWGTHPIDTGLALNRKIGEGIYGTFRWGAGTFDAFVATPVDAVGKAWGSVLSGEDLLEKYPKYTSDEAIAIGAWVCGGWREKLCVPIIPGMTELQGLAAARQSANAATRSGAQAARLAKPPSQHPSVEPAPRGGAVIPVGDRAALSGERRGPTVPRVGIDADGSSAKPPRDPVTLDARRGSDGKFDTGLPMSEKPVTPKEARRGIPKNTDELSKIYRAHKQRQYIKSRAWIREFRTRDPNLSDHSFLYSERGQKIFAESALEVHDEVKIQRHLEKHLEDFGTKKSTADGVDQSAGGQAIRDLTEADKLAEREYLLKKGVPEQEVDTWLWLMGLRDDLDKWNTRELGRNPVTGAEYQARKGDALGADLSRAVARDYLEGIPPEIRNDVAVLEASRAEEALRNGATRSALAAPPEGCPSGSCGGGAKGSGTLGKRRSGKKATKGHTTSAKRSDHNPAFRRLRNYPERLGRGGESWARANKDEVVKLRMRHPWWRYPDDPDMYTPRMSRLEVTEKSEVYVKRVEKLREVPALARKIPETRHAGDGVVIQKRVRGISYDELLEHPEVTADDIERLEREVRQLRKLAEKQLKGESTVVQSKDGKRAYDVGLDFNPEDNVLYEQDASGKWQVGGIYDPIGVGDAPAPRPPAALGTKGPGSKGGSTPFLRRDTDGHLYGLGDESSNPVFKDLPTLRDADGAPITRVVVHGNEAGVVGADGLQRSPAALGAELDRLGVEGPLWLVSCRTGRGEVNKPYTFGTASDLARETGRPVIAADRSVTVGAKGRIFHKPNPTAPMDSMWFLFERDENGVVRRTPLRETSLSFDVVEEVDKTHCTTCAGSTRASSLASSAAGSGFTLGDRSSPWQKLREYPVRVSDSFPRGGSEHFVRRTQDRSKYIKMKRSVIDGKKLPRGVQDEAGSMYAEGVRKLREDPYLHERLPETVHLGRGVLETDGLPGVKYAEMAKAATPAQKQQAEREAFALSARLHDRARALGMSITDDGTPSPSNPQYLLQPAVDVMGPNSSNFLYDYDPVSQRWAVYSPDPISILILDRTDPNVFAP